MTALHVAEETILQYSEGEMTLTNSVLRENEQTKKNLVYQACTVEFQTSATGSSKLAQLKTTAARAHTCTRCSKFIELEASAGEAQGLIDAGASNRFNAHPNPIARHRTSIGFQNPDPCKP